MKRMGIMGGSVLSVGQNRAVIVAEEDITTRFNDVTGVDEAKKAVRESTLRNCMNSLITGNTGWSGQVSQTRLDRSRKPDWTGPANQAGQVPQTRLGRPRKPDWTGPANQTGQVVYFGLGLKYTCKPILRRCFSTLSLSFNPCGCFADRLYIFAA